MVSLLHRATINKVNVPDNHVLGMMVRK